eukprot:snap_masked-scaffold_35-processed-gene-0.18-mRNA-1 protein AED:0.03 eAED:0.03 QI:0/-1/0/1/-1/1/1/0/114
MTESIPLLLLNDALSRQITLEMKTGDKYYGSLSNLNTETMSMDLTDVLHTSSEGQKRKIQGISIRGNQIKFIILPDIMSNSPVLQKVSSAKKKYEKMKTERLKARMKHRKFYLN